MKLPLTISLLASNRTALLERCLDSLKPLLQQVPAELIVVFTGTDARVRQIAEAYTDQVIPFAWCNDFSAARNEGLKHAKGEWFLYLDDDEWFDDVTEICDFFRSGEYLRFHSASYVSRNYTVWNGTGYTEFAAYRMARRTPDLHFENPIHEELMPFYGPCKVFHSFVHHYGYLKKTVSKSTGKDRRNIPLLREDIAKRPDYVKNYAQLAQEYFAMQKWEQAEAACRQGLKVCTKEDFAYQSWLQSYLVETLYKKGDYEQAKREALRILEEGKPCELVRLVLYLMLITICAAKDLSEKTLAYGEAFEKLLSHMEQNPTLWIEQRIGTVNRDKVMNPNWLYPARFNCIRAALELSKQEKAEAFLKLLPWEAEYGIEAYYPLLDQWKADYPSLLPGLLAALPYDSPYLLMQRFLSSEDPFLFHRCLKELKHPYLQQQLMKKALQIGNGYFILMERMDLDSWNNCITGIVEETPYDELQYLWEAEEKILTGHYLQGLWLKKLLLEKQLLCGFLMKKELLEALEAYALCTQAYYQELYQEAFFREGQRCLLPAECRASFVVLDALDAWKQGKPAETLRLFRTALPVAPQITGVIREVIRIISNEIMHPAPAAGSEFEQLAVQMKAALNTMVQDSRYTEAMSILSQLLPLLPNDMELLKLQQQLLSKIC